MVSQGRLRSTIVAVCRFLLVFSVRAARWDSGTNVVVAGLLSCHAALTFGLAFLLARDLASAQMRRSIFGNLN